MEKQQLKEQNGRCKDVNFGSYVWQSQMKLGCHVIICTMVFTLELTIFVTINRTCKAEVNHDQGSILLNQKILKFYVPVNNAFFVNLLQNFHNSTVNVDCHLCRKMTFLL